MPSDTPPNIVELARSVRFCINPLLPLDSQLRAPRSNTFAGWPSPEGWGLPVELIVTCVGRPDRQTGYLLHISRIDETVRAIAIERVHRELSGDPAVHPAAVLARLLPDLAARIPGLIRLAWRVTPYYLAAVSVNTPDRVLLAQQFEFAAAHRLHCQAMDDSANQRAFGKCNNPNGHGHNYRLEVSMIARLDPASGTVAPGLRGLETIVHEHVISRFDHQHLNLDSELFAELNPSVENIARVCHELLEDPIRRAGGLLHQVRLWETEKTSCTYPAPSSTEMTPLRETDTLRGSA